MTPIVSAYRRPNGLMIALQVLGGIDLMLSLIGMITAIIGLSLTPRLGNFGGDQWVGATMLIVALQILPRAAELIVRAIWTRCLVGNLHLFQPCKISTFWAVAGFFMPVVSLWMPGQMNSVLTRTGGKRSHILDGLGLAWALTRWLTCFSGAFASLFCFSIVLAATTPLRGRWPPEYSLIWELTLCGIGLLSAAFGLVITPWITRRQPRPDQIHHAEVFG